jgi:hypothetical protein
MDLHYNTSKIHSFCETFLVEECRRDEGRKHRHYDVVSELLDFLRDKKYIPEGHRDAVRSHVDHCRSVNGEKIRKAIQDLDSLNYWDSIKENNRKGRTNNPKEFTYSSALGLCMKEVRDDGWLFKVCDFDMTQPVRSLPLGLFPQVGNDRCMLLRLPTEVAKLGRKDMTISDTGLQYRRGVWRPYALDGQDHGGSIVGDVYPYRFF